MTEEWVCVGSCPIRLLGEQSGPARSSGHINVSKAGHDNASVAFGDGMWAVAKPGQNTYSDKGTAARFFMQFGGEDNLIEPVQEESSVQVINDDCVRAMQNMPENSVDSVVCDPPYGLVEPRSLKGFGTAQRNGGRSEEDKEQRRGGFMGKKWDDTGHGIRAQLWHEAWAREALRVLRPGGYLLAFGGTRTVHRLACAIEDAGFEIRDRLLHIGGDATESMPGEIAWVYGSG